MVMMRAEHSLTLAPGCQPWSSRTGASADPPVIVDVEGASVRVGGRTIWHDLSLTVRAGEVLAVLGPNGAGKSTLLKSILGLVPLTAGNIRVLDSDPWRARSTVGYLPQRRTFDADIRLRGRDLVQLGLDGARWGVPLPRLWRRSRAEKKWQLVTDAIATVDATTYADRPIGELSGGEQQRLLIAQALVTHPRLLLLDEPLEGLDMRTQQSVSALVRRIATTENMAVLLVAHDVNPILPYLDRAVYLAHGQMAAGAPAEVITTETLSRLYGTPVDVLRTRDGRIVVVGQPEEETHHVQRSR